MSEKDNNLIKKNNYEITLIFSTRQDDYQETKKKVENLFQEFDMNVTGEKDLGNKEFAYPILKNTHGHYYSYMLNASAPSVKKFTKEISLIEKVFRYMIIHIDKKAQKYLDKLNKKEKERKAV